MKKLIKSNAFIIGFFSGILLFLCLNYYTVMQAYKDICVHCLRAFGYPFTFFETGGAVTRTDIFWFSLIVNILIATISCFVCGLAFKFVWLKTFSRRLSLK